MPGPRKRWALTEEAFDALLSYLDANRDVAGERFEELRERLLNYFSFEAVMSPDYWADTVLDRLAKRVAEGVVQGDIFPYARGIARMVLWEARAAANREQDNRPDSGNSSEPEQEKRLATLERCIARLPYDAKSLIEDYYLKRSSSLPESRKRLAERLGVSAEALRSRALRIRKELEKCVRESENPGTISEISTTRNRNEID